MLGAGTSHAHTARTRRHARKGQRSPTTEPGPPADRTAARQGADRDLICAAVAPWPFSAVRTTLARWHVLTIEGQVPRTQSGRLPSACVNRIVQRATGRGWHLDRFRQCPACFALAG